MDHGIIVSSIATAIAVSAAVMIAATGELLVEKTGVYNIGLEGVMLISALAGFLAANGADSWLAGLLVGALVGAVFALIFGVITVVMRADMVVVGIGLILLALGITGEVGASHVREAVTSPIPVWHIPGLSSIPYVGPALFQQAVTTYLAFLLPVAALLLLSRTRHGLKMRAIGENPSAADAAGIPVIGWRLFYVGVGGFLAGIGGAVLVLSVIGSWVPNITAGQGWIAFAIVFFAGWRPMWIIAGALLFGVLATLGNVGQAEGWSIPNEVFTALPYLGTVAVTIGRAWVRRRQGAGLGWPAALGVPFYRD
ncbi:MAG: ral nucleoside transport system permease protein [Solirubrobacterales bacterium]|jgi:simple sugar transport system permease protein|nr:ral nucleoside transport system permease protein [Solirubrobacterales bacterium]